MAKIYSSVANAVGKTPLFEVKNIERELSLCARLLVKAELFNPTGSSKDRAALEMILDAEERGILKRGSVIIEPTSGNTGIGLAAIGVPRGYRVIIVMPDSMSEERRRIMRAYGAELVLTDGSLGMRGAIERAEELAREIPNSFIPDQFENLSNPLAHYKTTGPEIYEDTDGEVDIFVCGVGTGGTISGVGKYLKERKPGVKIVAVEPDTSAVLSGGSAGAHKLQGIGAGFIPGALDTEIYDEIVSVSAENAYSASRLIAGREGILVGISSGAALHAAIELAKLPENAGKTVVALLPDTGSRYLSTDLFE